MTTTLLDLPSELRCRIYNEARTLWKRDVEELQSGFIHRGPIVRPIGGFGGEAYRGVWQHAEAVVFRGDGMVFGVTRWRGFSVKRRRGGATHWTVIGAPAGAEAVMRRAVTKKRQEYEVVGLHRIRHGNSAGRRALVLGGARESPEEAARKLADALLSVL